MNIQEFSDPSSLSADLDEVDLGDQRLNNRLSAIVDMIASSPAESFPDLIPHDADLEAFYRFINNDRAKTRPNC